MKHPQAFDLLFAMLGLSAYPGPVAPAGILENASNTETKGTTDRQENDAYTGAHGETGDKRNTKITGGDNIVLISARQSRPRSKRWI